MTSKLSALEHTQSKKNGINSNNNDKKEKNTNQFSNFNKTQNIEKFINGCETIESNNELCQEIKSISIESSSSKFEFNKLHSSKQNRLELNEKFIENDVGISNMADKNIKTRRISDIRNSKEFKFSDLVYKDSFNNQYHDQVNATGIGFHLLCLLIVSGGMTLSGTMVPVSPFDFNSTNNILFYVLPMIFASLSSFISIFFKEIFNSEKRLFMTIINIIFVILTVCLHLSTKIIPLYLTIRTFQGITVGLMSFIYPITLKQVCTKKLYKTYFVAFFLFFCIGLFVFRSIGAHWIKLICIVPFMQSLLIWILEYEKYIHINSSSIEFFYSELLFNPIDSFGEYFAQSFIGSFAFWNYINRYNENILPSGKLVIFLFLSILIYSFILFLLKNISYTYARHIYYSCLFLSLLGYKFCLSFNETIGLYYLVVLNSSLIFIFCLDNYIIINRNDSFRLSISWFLFWLSNAFSALIYLKTKQFTWYIIGVSILVIYFLFKNSFCIIMYVKEKINEGRVDSNNFSIRNKSLKLIIYLLSAISIGSSIVGYCRFSNNSHVIAYHAIPFFAAALSSIITIIMKFDLEDESMLFFKNRELLLFVVNIVFIISTSFVGHSNNIIVILIFRFIQGICIGFLSFITSIMISEVQKEYFKYYILSFGFGLCLGNIFLSKWPILSLSSSILQASLILICKPNEKLYEINLELEPFSVSLNAIEAFYGVIGIFIVISTKTKTKFEGLQNGIFFILAVVFGYLVIKLLFDFQNELPYAFIFTSLFIIFLYFLISMHYIKGGYIELVLTGFVFSFPWVPYLIYDYCGTSFIFTWGCFWLANFFASLIFTCPNFDGLLLILQAICYILISTLVIGLLSLWAHECTSEKCFDSEFIWDVLLRFGGILVGTIIAPGYYDCLSIDPYSALREYSLYIPLFGLLGALIAIGIVLLSELNIISIIEDVRILFFMTMLEYILFTVLMNTEGGNIILFKYLQSLVIGILSILIPLMMSEISGDYFTHAMCFYLLMISVGIFIVYYFERFYIYIVYTISILYSILIWFTNNWVYGCQLNILDYNCEDCFNIAMALVAPIFNIMGCNLLWNFHYNKIVFYTARSEATTCLISQIIRIITFTYDCGANSTFEATNIIFLFFAITGFISSIAFILGANKSRKQHFISVYSFGFCQIPFLSNVNNNYILFIALYMIMNWFWCFLFNLLR